MRRRTDSDEPDSDRPKLLAVEFSASEYRILEAVSRREERSVAQVVRYRLRDLWDAAAAELAERGVAV